MERASITGTAYFGSSFGRRASLSRDLRRMGRPGGRSTPMVQSRRNSAGGVARADNWPSRAGESMRWPRRFGRVSRRATVHQASSRPASSSRPKGAGKWQER